MFIRNVRTVELHAEDGDPYANVEVETNNAFRGITLCLDRTVDPAAEDGDDDEYRAVEVSLTAAQAVELIGHLTDAVGYLMRRQHDTATAPVA